MTIFNGVNGSSLWKGDVTTGVFTEVGVINGEVVVDIACDTQGNLYANTITDDALYSVNSATGVGTFIGQHGFDTRFAQGMDFDWSMNTIYAALYVGSGTGFFCSLNVSDGSLLTTEDTTSLDLEAVFAVQAALPGFLLGTNHCAANRNTTGLTGVIQAVGSTDTAVNKLTISASRLPVNQFGLFITSMTSDFVPFANPTSSGNLCLGGAIGRYASPPQCQDRCQPPPIANEAHDRAPLGADRALGRHNRLGGRSLPW